MSYPELVVEPEYAPSVFARARRIGKLGYMWSRLLAPFDRWNVHHLATRKLSFVVGGRVVTVSVRWEPGLKFVECEAGVWRVALVWFDDRTLWKANEQWRQIARMQRFYDATFRRSDLQVQELQASGLLDLPSVKRTFGDKNHGFRLWNEDGE